MSDPEKQPKDIKPSKETAVPADETAVPAAANNNEASEPKASITPVVEQPKKDPVVPAAVIPAAPTAETPNAAPASTEAPAVEAQAAEAPAAEVVPPANDNATAEAPAVTVEAAAPVAAAPSKGKGYLKKAFTFAAKMAAGAATSAILKTVTVTVAGIGMTAAPAWATIVVSGAVAGIGTAFLHDAIKRYEQKKKGLELAPYFSKAHGKQLAKNVAISTVAAVAGSVLYLGCHDTVLGWWNHLTGHTAAVTPPVAPVVAQPTAPVAAPVAPPVEHIAAPAIVAAPAVVPVHCASPMEQFGDLVKGHHVSAQVQQALHRAASGNAHVHAQGLKDLAYYAQNGFGGVPKDHNVALELFKQAADGGNVQSKVDMLYLQHYGLDGVTADKAASLSTMSDIHTAKATEFVKAWGGAGKHLKHVDFDTKSILKGMKVGCAA